MDIQELLKEATKDTLSQENLKKITEAVEGKAKEIAKGEYDLKLEAALAKQDGEYADKLQKFLEDIDNDHTDKMKMLIEGMDRKHYGMLQDVINKYKQQYLTECKSFKDSLVEKVDKFFDIVVEEQIPVKELHEAVENTRHKKLVEEISKLIGFDKLQQNQLVKEGLMDAKSKIDQLNEQVQKLTNEKKRLLGERVHTKRSELLAEKTKGLPRAKKVYIEKVLGNKSLDFIKENFDLTLKLYDEEEETNGRSIKEEAMKKSKVISENVDRVEKQVVTEKKQPRHADMYMDELRQI